MRGRDGLSTADNGILSCKKVTENQITIRDAEIGML